MNLVFAVSFALMCCVLNFRFKFLSGFLVFGVYCFICIDGCHEMMDLSSLVVVCCLLEVFSHLMPSFLGKYS